MRSTFAFYGFYSIFAVLLLLRASSGFPTSTDGRVKRSTADINLTNYIRQALISYRDVMKHGLPEFSISPLEPIKLDNLSFDGDARGVRVKSNFTNMTLYGVSTMDVRTLETNLTQKILKMGLTFTNWTVTGLYNMTGKVIGIIPLYGNGTFTMVATDITMTGTAPLIIHSNGTLAVGHLDLDVTAQDVDLHFHNLYGGGSWGKFVSRIANFFADTIFNKAKPKIIRNLRMFVTNSLNRKLATVNVATL